MDTSKVLKTNTSDRTGYVITRKRKWWLISSNNGQSWELYGISVDPVFAGFIKGKDMFGNDVKVNQSMVQEFLEIANTKRIEFLEFTLDKSIVLKQRQGEK